MTLTSSEPRMKLTAAPVWLMVVLFISLYWLMLYFDQHRGWFNRYVYMPYSSLLEVQELWSSQAGQDDFFQRGAGLFKQNCAVCHMENGMGNSLNGCPPLLGSEWVTAPGAGRLIRIVSKGLTGTIEVKGQVLNSGFTMIPIGDQMAGGELEKPTTSQRCFVMCGKPLGAIRSQSNRSRSWLSASKSRAALCHSRNKNSKKSPKTSNPLQPLGEKQRSGLNALTAARYAWRSPCS